MVVLYGFIMVLLWFYIVCCMVLYVFFDFLYGFVCFVVWFYMVLSLARQIQLLINH